MSQTNAAKDRGPTFDGVKIGRPATGALIDAGHESKAGLAGELGQLADGVGPRAVQLLKEARGR